MIIKHLILVLMGVLLSLITLHITATMQLLQSDGTKDAIFGDILNNIDNSFITTTITNSTNKSNMTAKDSTIDETAHSFEESFAKLVSETQSLSLSYQNEIGKWQLNHYDNISMISITNDYLQRFQEIVEKITGLKPPSAEYKRALDLFAKSIQSEMASHIHFQNFLATGDLKEDERSIQLFSDAFKYEKEAFDAFKAAVN
ncbi:MAG: hypothetical protein M3156_00230 [Thermoproteota archaeon]|nr:hypothetical protein [Thermoproteota archaeon]